MNLHKIRTVLALGLYAILSPSVLAGNTFLHNSKEEIVWMRYQTDTQIQARMWINGRFAERKEVPEYGVFCDIKDELEMLIDERMLFMPYTRLRNVEKFKSYLSLCESSQQGKVISDAAKSSDLDREFFHQ